MTIYVWHTGHPINETLSSALHAGIPGSILKHTEFASNYINSNNKNICVGYGILRGTGDVFRHNAFCGVDYYEVDRGYINPGHFNGYYRISKNDIQASYIDKDLSRDRVSKLKFVRGNWFNPRGQIIVCPPTEYIEHYSKLSPNAWTEEAIKMLSHYNIPFKLRNKGDTSPLESDLNGCRGVLTYNSNVAVDASIKGVPVVATYGIVKGWSKNTFQKFVDSSMLVPTDEEIDKLLRFISYNQFTLEEIRNGTAWRLLHDM